MNRAFQANTTTASLLRENPQQRPNIYQVMKEVCLMRGTDVPIKDVRSTESPYWVGHR